MQISVPVEKVVSYETAADGRLDYAVPASWLQRMYRPAKMGAKHGRVLISKLSRKAKYELTPYAMCPKVRRRKRVAKYGIEAYLMKGFGAARKAVMTTTRKLVNDPERFARLSPKRQRKIALGGLRLQKLVDSFTPGLKAGQHAPIG